MTNETYTAVPCDVRWPDNNHTSCSKCDGYGRVPIITPDVRDQFLQWAVGTLLVFVAAMTILAVWARR